MTSYSFQAQRLVEQAHSFTEDLGEDPAVGVALASEALVYAVLSVSEQLHKLVATQAPAGPEPIERIDYRAYFESMPLGLYSTREAARAHCLGDAAKHGDDVTGATWLPLDEDALDGSEEHLVLQADGENLTDYSVMPLTVATAYDPDAED